MSSPELELSVVVVTKDTARTLQPILACLQEQTIAGEMEVVVVAPDEEAGRANPPFAEGFGKYTVVPAGPVKNRGGAAARGVLRASAPVVALTENHCFPDRDWGERTVAAHRRGGWAGVGPAVMNANPETKLSLVMHAAGYGMFPDTASGGPVDQLPLHNSSFDRRVVEELADDLEFLLEDERRFHARLLERSETLYFDPSIRKLHINEATWGLMAGLVWDSGRRYAAGRSEDWPRAKKLAYGMASPLLTLPILRNQWALLSQSGIPGAGSPMAASIAAAWSLGHAIGEGSTYLFGAPGEFSFTEDDEFMIRERLGGVPLSDERIRGYVEMLDS